MTVCVKWDYLVGKAVRANLGATVQKLCKEGFEVTSKLWTNSLAVKSDFDIVHFMKILYMKFS